MKKKRFGLVARREMKGYIFLLPWLIGRADFISAAVPPQRHPRPGRRVRALWTVRDEETCAECLDRGDMPIFEGFMPERR